MATSPAPLVGEGCQCARRAIGVHIDEGIRHLYHRGWAAVAIGHLEIGAGRVEVLPFPDAVRVGTLEAVDGLVIVAHDANFSGLPEVGNRGLLGLVEVLILVNEEMLEFGALCRRRIVLEVTD